VNSEKVKKLVAILIVLFMVTSCLAVGMAIAESGRTEESVQKRAGDEKKAVDSVTGELAYLEDFRWDMPDRTETNARNRTGDDKAAALLVEGLSDTEDLHKAGGKTGTQKGRRSDEEAESEVERLSVTGDFTDDFTRDFRGDFRRASSGIAEVEWVPLQISLQPPRCSSGPFDDTVGDIFVNETDWWEDGGAFNSSDKPLQDAINYSSGGDTIFVYNGTYNESLTINKSLTLIGEHRDTTFIDGMGADCITVTDVVTQVNVEIKGFTIHNGSAGIYIESGVVTVTVSDNNISANAYGGVQVNATSSIVANIMCNIIADNGCDCGDVFTGGGIRLYVNESTGTIDATIQDNNIEYNRCGGIRIGWWGASLGYFGNASGPFAGLQRVCGTIDATIDNNTISNNKDGSIRIKSRDTLDANVTNNYIGNINETRAGGLVRLGWVSGRAEDDPEEDYEYPTAFVTANVSNNIIECGNDSNNVSTGGIIRIVANDTIDATVHENEMHGGHAIGGVIRIGRGCFTKNVTATVINNTLDFADLLGSGDDHSHGGGGVGGFIRLDASDTIDAAINENNITGAQDCNSGVIRIGPHGDDDISTENVTADVIGNVMNFGNSSGIAGFIRIKANDTINATIEDNTIIGGTTGIGGVIRIGNRYPFDDIYPNNSIGTKQVTAMVINNVMDCGSSSAIAGFIRIVANDSISATIEDNNIIGGGSSVGGVIRIGHGDDNTNLSSTSSVNATVINNTMDCGSSSGIAGFIRIKASDTLDATIEDNNITGGRGIVGGVIHIGHNDPVPAEKVTVNVTGNVIDCSNSAGIAGFIKIKARDTLDATIKENRFIGGGSSVGGVIRIGIRWGDSWDTRKVTVTVIDNIMDCSNSAGIGGFIRIKARDTLDATINENTIIGGHGGVGGVIRIGHGDPFTREVTATVNNNEINLTRVGSECDDPVQAGIGGVIRIKANDTINANITGNNIYGTTLPFTGGGIRIGFDCDEDPCKEVTAVVNDNYLAPCKGGGIRLFANDTLDATVTNNIVSGNNGSGIRIGYFCWGGGQTNWDHPDESTPTVNATVINNTVTDNYGSGIHVSARDSLTAVIDRNNISNNTYCGYPDSEYVANGSGLYIEGPSDVTITRNTFIDNALYGIYCNGTTAKIAYGNVFYNNTEGIRCENGANPTIYHNGFVNNTDFGVKNNDSSLTVNAEHNWWGNNTGPYHAVSNPNGTGDNVSDDVDYVPWVTQLNITTPDPNVTILCSYIVADPGEDPNFVPPPFGMAAYPLGFSIIATGPADQDVVFYVTFDSPIPTHEDFGLYKILPSGEWQLIDPANYTIAGNVLTITLHFDSTGNLDPAFQFASVIKLPILTPLGLLALISVLSVIAVISIIRKKEREGN
jgi:hypothetical protein